MYETWTTPTTRDTIPAGVYDMKIHVHRAPDRANEFKIDRMHVPEDTTLIDLDVQMARLYDGPTIVLKIQVVPEPVSDQVTLTRAEYSFLMTQARQGANANGWRSSQRLNTIKKEHG